MASGRWTLTSVTLSRPSTADLARQLFRADRWKDAARVARLATQQDPAFADEGATIVGVSLLRIGRTAEAKAALDYALARNPSSPTLQLAYAQLALSTGDDTAYSRVQETATVGVEKQLAALRQARRELPSNDAITSLDRGDTTTKEQWEAAMRLTLALETLDDAERLCKRPPPSVSPASLRAFEARTATVRGDSDAAIPAWRAALQLNPALSSEAFEAMLELNALDEATEVARSAHARSESPLLLARLALYGGRLEDARALFGEVDDPARRSALAALALLSGQPDEARALLANAERGPADELLYIEALRRGGHVADATRAFAELSSDSLVLVAAAPLCRIAITAAAGPNNDEDRELLAALRRDFPDLAAIANPAEFAQAALNALSGNWSRRATRPDAEGIPRPQSIARPIRERVAALRQGLTQWPLRTVVTHCERLEARHGAHTLICNYGAELLLWAGDYERAQAWLDRAFELAPRSRWTFIGAATLQNVTGHPELALATIARQRELVPPLPNSFICTAEAHLRLGDPARAQADYEVAVAAHPTRVGAWLGLGQAQVLQGVDPEHALERVRQLVPTFFQQWQREAAALGGAERFDRAFTMLRGNRGSGLITWWTADGTFHGEQVVREALVQPPA